MERMEVRGWDWSGGGAPLFLSGCRTTAAHSCNFHSIDFPLSLHRLQNTRQHKQTAGSYTDSREHSKNITQQNGISPKFY